MNDTSSVESCTITDLPDDLLDAIFLYLPGRDLCQSCMLVSKRWKRIIDNESFWIQKCLANSNLMKCLERSAHSHNWHRLAKIIYCSNFFDRNLLRNPRGQKQFDYWCICNESTRELRDSKYSGSREKLKELCDFYRQNQIVHLSPIKSEDDNRVNRKLKKHLPVPNWRVEINENQLNRDMCLFDSFKTKGFGEKMQLIDLECELGHCAYTQLMNELKPNIEIYEYYRVHNSECCEYSLVVYLISSEYELIDSFLFRDKSEQKHSDWKCVYHKFLNENFNGSIVRFILFYHSGKVGFICIK